MNIIIVIAVVVGAFLLVATFCCIMAALNPPKEYMGATKEEKENVNGKKGEPL